MPLPSILPAADASLEAHSPFDPAEDLITAEALSAFLADAEATDTDGITHSMPRIACHDKTVPDDTKDSQTEQDEITKKARSYAGLAVFLCYSIPVDA